MLSKNKRIPRNLFPLFNQKVKTFQNKLFFMKIAPYNTNSRFCFSISKKVAKKAVTRNKLRRIGYHFLNQYLSQIKSKNLILFSFRKITEKREEVDRELKSILKDSNLIQ